MRSFLHTFSVFVFLLVPVPAFAQDAQTGGALDAAPAAQTEPGTPTSSSDQNAGSASGGFMGFGEKKLQRVRGVPLPTQRSSRPLFAAAQTGSVRDINPSYPIRRSKPNVGEMSTDFPARMIYLNGRNISSVREQQLEGVTVRIDSNGNLHISAPQYEVQESTHYRPLLPRDVPRVSKPEPQNDEPLLSRGGRFSKSPAGGEGANLTTPGAVPPVEVDEESEAPVQAPAQAPASPQKPASPATDQAASGAQKL
ncbi:MAG: hypothetical protein RI932_2415 [Pseudomonadota bacterium]|jgi:hypothetical protein